MKKKNAVEVENENAATEQNQTADVANKDSNKNAKKMNKLPVCLRLILVFVPLIMLAVSIVLTIFSIKANGTGVGADFTIQPMAVALLTILPLVVALGLFVMQFVFPKVIFKKKSVTKPGVFFNAVSLIVTLILCFYCTGFSGAYKNNNESSYDAIISEIQGWDVSHIDENDINKKDDNGMSDYDKIMSLLNYLNDHSVKRAYKNTGASVSGSTTYDHIAPHFASLDNKLNYVTYDIYVPGGFDSFFESVELNRIEDTTDVHIQESEYGLPGPYDHVYGMKTEISPDFDNIYGFGVDLGRGSYVFMLDKTNCAVRIVKISSF